MTLLIPFIIILTIIVIKHKNDLKYSNDNLTIVKNKLEKEIEELKTESKLIVNDETYGVNVQQMVNDIIRLNNTSQELSITFYEHIKNSNYNLDYIKDTFNQQLTVNMFNEKIITRQDFLAIYYRALNNFIIYKKNIK